MIVFPNCKINIGLQILQKRSDGFHDIETIFYPVGWQDSLEIIPDSSASPGIAFTASGLTINGMAGENICVKAYHLLAEKCPQLPAVKMHLHKVIPTGAGLGGGSANGAFVLMLLNKQFHLGLTEDDLLKLALVLGSDCPFFIKNKPSLASGRGENLSVINLDLTQYKIAIVHPGIHINTAWAFSQVSPNNNRPGLRSIFAQPIDTWKISLINDFEAPIFQHYPTIKKCKDDLYAAGAIYASLSGSGSSVYGIFKKEAATKFNFPPEYFVKII